MSRGGDKTTVEGREADGIQGTQESQDGADEAGRESSTPVGLKRARPCIAVASPVSPLWTVSCSNGKVIVLFKPRTAVICYSCLRK